MAQRWIGVTLIPNDIYIDRVRCLRGEVFEIERRRLVAICPGGGGIMARECRAVHRSKGQVTRGLSPG